MSFGEWCYASMLTACFSYVACVESQVVIFKPSCGIGHHWAQRKRREPRTRMSEGKGSARLSHVCSDHFHACTRPLSGRTTETCTTLLSVHHTRFIRISWLILGSTRPAFIFGGYIINHTLGSQCRIRPGTDLHPYQTHPAISCNKLRVNDARVSALHVPRRSSIPRHQHPFDKEKA